MGALADDVAEAENVGVRLVRPAPDVKNARSLALEYVNVLVEGGLGIVSVGNATVVGPVKFGGWGPV